MGLDQMSTDSTEEETAGAETEKPLLQRKMTRRDAIKYSIIGGVCLAGISSIIYFLLKEAKKGSLTQVFKGQAPNKLWKWS